MPFLDDGTPMPTRYWLVGERDRLLVSRIESKGGIAEAESVIDPEALLQSHLRYAAERDADIPTNYEGPRPSGGVGGTRRGLKCLHAHYAWFLVGGKDPAGFWVAEQIEAAIAEEVEGA